MTATRGDSAKNLIHNSARSLPKIGWISSTTRLDLIHTRLYLIHTRLDLIHTRLDLIHALMVDNNSKLSTKRIIQSHADLLESWTPDVAGRVNRSPSTRYTDLHKKETVCYDNEKKNFKTGSFSPFFRTFFGEKSAKTNLQRRSGATEIALWKISTVQLNKESKEAQ